MKILWIVNMLLPEIAEYLNTTTSASGTWMIDFSKKLSKENNIVLGIACVYGNKFQKITINKITYYLLPGNGRNMLFYTRKYEKIWANINEDFEPDIVHLHGTEYSHGLSYLRVSPNIKSVVSLQGLLNRIKDVDFGEISPFIYLCNRTKEENLHFNGVIESHFLNKKNAKYEKEILNRTLYVNGVNTWDISLAKAINPNLTAFKIEYNLRDEIYNAEKWDIDKIKRHSIFTNPGGTPLKGLHQLIKAVALIKERYPDIVIKIPGMSENGIVKVKTSYEKYLIKLIEKLGLKENVCFLGRQSASQIAENIQRANVVVIPSAIEGTSMILREAMYIGCPSIASFRGGMADYISDKHDGYLYDFQEYPYLAMRISEIFDNDDLCKKISKCAIKKAEKSHDRINNINSLISMYEMISKN